MRTVRHLAAALATTGLVVAAGSAPAGAGTPGGQTGHPIPDRSRGHCLEYRGTTGCFVEHGDWFKVHDGRSDGLRPEVQWETDYGRTGLCIWRGSGYWTSCNHNFRERTYVGFRIILRRVSSGTVVDGTSWAEAPNFT